MSIPRTFGYLPIAHIPYARTLHTARPSRLKRVTSVAPMIDVTNLHYHHLLRLISPHHTLYTELHHAHAILRNQQNIRAMLGDPHPDTVVQLGGNEPAMMAKAAKILQDEGFGEINLNVGCPSEKVQAGTFGAVLMKSPERVKEMLEEMTREGVTVPVSVKCRTGVDDMDSYEFLYNFINTLVTSRNPPSHLIIHARKCWLHGLSPAQNRTIPPLLHDRVWCVANDFPNLVVTVNGGFDNVDMVQMGLSRVDGVMVGRKVMDGPMFLQTLDQAIHNAPPTKTADQIFFQYLDYAARKQRDWESSRVSPLNILLKPVQMLFSGGKGRRFRKHLGEAISKGKKGGWNIVRVGEVAWEGMTQEMDGFERERAGSEHGDVERSIVAGG